MKCSITKTNNNQVCKYEIGTTVIVDLHKAARESKRDAIRNNRESFILDSICNYCEVNGHNLSGLELLESSRNWDISADDYKNRYLVGVISACDETYGYDVMFLKYGSVSCFDKKWITISDAPIPCPLCQSRLQ